MDNLCAEIRRKFSAMNNRNLETDRRHVQLSTETSTYQSFFDCNNLFILILIQVKVIFKIIVFKL